MRSLVALLLATACAIARPPGPLATVPTPAAPPLSAPYRRPVTPMSARDYVGDFFYDRFMFPHFRNDIIPREPGAESDWLTKEIDRINRMQEEEDGAAAYDTDASKWIAREPYLERVLANAKKIMQARHAGHDYEPQISNPIDLQLPLPQSLVAPEYNSDYIESKELQDKREQSNNQPSRENNSNFALTPTDKGYYDVDSSMKNQTPIPMQEHVMHEGGDPQTAMLLEAPRQIRQNPMSRSKTLVAENLDRLRTGLSHEEGHSTAKPRHVHILETSNDPAESIYGVALIAAIGAAITMAVFGFAIGWYTLFKKAKAAADVDYPAYGVTGPTVDTSGDRKLAHSAHMYHYQHQKQQIIAMERNGMEQRNGSVSDPESEEENEEGDYTVYECPGFATTGDMEVKNPLFSDDPTPATPGKCEVVKPQPKD
ncbi:protein cab-1 isoform X2 [Plodia interpunctella]|uniref:protein cab-1 isoform X2 n=1 Tax=Plodia interpunctella TaxID=58824 RepID=UPI002368A617|nr:protein cab-1 isoform X2 [Plodia interpunctella]